ncbi:MAG: metallophosphoesterase [Hormoscilla sp. GUM202]|nr:metallophosphoesterase [Hormoscilla sp. GUM202]
MPRFLHVADVHLGFDRYENAERTKDFFLAFQDALEKYAVREAVDFVVIAGDLFEHRHILPATLNQAQVCLDMLKEAGIPVLAIEGNHDNQPYGTKSSWLRYLADWEKLILLEPNEAATDGTELYDLWTPEMKTGGYIDLDCKGSQVRVLGSRWYGAAASQTIVQLAAAIELLPEGPQHTVMIFHHGLEGQIARYEGALRYQDLLPLKDAGVDYLALGHIHKHYTAEGWIFNPGSVEANSIAESQGQNPRGVYLVEISERGINAQLKQDYYQRSILRLNLEVNKQQTLVDLEEAAREKVQAVAQQGKTKQAIVELRISGQLGFNRLDLNVRSLRQQLHRECEALIFLLKYDATGTEYETPLLAGDRAPTKSELELQVFEDLLAANVYYSQKAPELAKALIDMKDRVLNNQPVENIYEFVQQLLIEKSS